MQRMEPYCSCNPCGPFSNGAFQIQFSNLQTFKNSWCSLFVTIKGHEEDTESTATLIYIWFPLLSTSCTLHTILDILYILKAPKTSGAKIILSLEGKGGEETKQATSEPSLIGEGRQENRAEEEGKGLGKARDAHKLINLSPSQF